jgi:hypothetical protein
LKKGINVLKIPGSVRIIGAQAFAANAVKLGELIFGGAGDPTQIETVYKDSFTQGSGKDFSKVTYYATSTPDENIAGILSVIENV